MSIVELVHKNGQASVSMHDVIFEMAVTEVDGKLYHPDMNVANPIYSLENVVIAAIERGVPNFYDHNSYGAPRLDVYHPEFSMQSMPTFAVVEFALGSHGSLPITKADATEQLPISVEHLIEVVPDLIADVYARGGLTMSLLSVRFVKTLNRIDSGEYMLK